MSVLELANTIAKAVKYTQDNSGKAKLGVYNNGFVSTDVGNLAAVKAVPVNLYNGKMVWVQVTANNTAVIIGD